MPAQLSQDELVEQLGKKLQTTLGLIWLMQDADVRSLTLQGLPRGTRLMLTAYDIMAETLASGAHCLTKFGEEVAKACYGRRRQIIDYDLTALEFARMNRAAQQLPEELQQTLALLADVPLDVAELTLAMQQHRDRETLALIGAIHPKPQAKADDSVELTLTDFGRGIIGACAYLQANDEQRAAIDNLAEARRHYFDTLP